MAKYSIAETKDHLSELVERARAGEEITITSQDVPVAVLKGIQPQPRRLTQADIDWLEANRVGTVMPKEDAGTLVSRMRDEDWAR
jgi:prevent-host-death family protein